MDLPTMPLPAIGSTTSTANGPQLHRPLPDPSPPRRPQPDSPLAPRVIAGSATTPRASPPQLPLSVPPPTIEGDEGRGEGFGRGGRDTVGEAGGHRICLSAAPPLARAPPPSPSPSPSLYGERRREELGESGEELVERREEVGEKTQVYGSI
uniref:Uncharacterized protein n=1 Tax=Oryza punctata TaxID=4537 RepID=A0A0E0M6T5_ORYPU